MKTEELLDSARLIIERALIDHKPIITGAMFSGGDDSTALLEVLAMLGVKIDFIMHGVTRTGVQETWDFARKAGNMHYAKYIESDAGSAYARFVLKNGFMGRGAKAHNISFNELKEKPWHKTLSREFRKRRRNYPILLFTGAMMAESANRKKTMQKSGPIVRGKSNNIWVSPLMYGTKHLTEDIAKNSRTGRNPACVKLCRSAECMCGTTSHKTEYEETSFWYPDWGRKMDKLRAMVKARGHAQDWGEHITGKQAQERLRELRGGQLNLFKENIFCGECLDKVKECPI